MEGTYADRVRIAEGLTEQAARRRRDGLAYYNAGTRFALRGVASLVREGVSWDAAVARFAEFDTEGALAR